MGEFDLGKLNGSSVEAVKNQFLAISNSVTEITLRDDNFSTLSRSSPELLKSAAIAGALAYLHTPLTVEALSVLPPHINKITFSGEFIYTEHSIIKGGGNYENPRAISQLNRSVYYKRRIGEQLKKYVAALPKTITRVALEYSINPQDLRKNNEFCGYESTTIYDDLCKLVSALPPNVVSLDLRRINLEVRAGNDLYKLYNLLHSIPPTVKELALDWLCPYRDTPQLLSAIGPNIISLELNLGFSVYMFSQRDFEEECKINLNNTRALFSRLHNKLTTLRLRLSLAINSRELEKLQRLDYRKAWWDHFKELISSLPASLDSLNICENHLLSTDSEKLGNSLVVIPAGIKTVDLGETNLLSYPAPELAKVLSALPPTVTSVRLCKNDMKDYSSEKIIQQFNGLPQSLTGLRLNDSDLLELNPLEFKKIVSSLPKFLTELDLSGNNLADKLAELISLFEALPIHIKKLSLRRNNLSSLKPRALKALFCALPPQVRELDLSENGFAALPYSQMNQSLSSLPDGRIIFAENSLARRNDGSLMAHRPTLTQPNFFKSQAIFRHQRQFASLRPTLTPLIEKTKLGSNVWLRIFTYLFPFSPAGEIAAITSLATKILEPASLKKNQNELLEEREKCLNLLRYRLHTLSADAIELDLSRCGLNRLNEDCLSSEFKRIPNQVKRINFRGNGFCYSKESAKAFMSACKAIPQTIIYLDLSKNGFDLYEEEALRELFSHFSAGIELISLSYEMPMSPEEYFDRIQQDNSNYLKLTAIFTSNLSKSRAILADYSKGDSYFLSLVTGNRHRSHTNEVAHIVRLIDKGFINTIYDLQDTIEQVLKKNNEVLNKDLLQRIGFISRLAASQAAAEAVPIEQRRRNLGGLPLCG